MKPLSHIAQSILEVIKLLPGPITGRLVLGYSGGVDSEVLAFGMSELKAAYPEFQFTLIHVHHGLSNNADLWQKHCYKRARKYGLPFSTQYVSLINKPRQSLEAEARKLRYEALFSEMQADDVLLTGHHQNDQLETVLLALKRGQGPKGLSAMGRCQRNRNGMWQLRPLLNTSRDEIEGFAQQNNLTHIQDESNFDDSFDRNFLRLSVLPQLTQRWPAFASTASRSASLCFEQQTLLDEVIKEKLHACIEARKQQSTLLCLDKLKDYSVLWQKQILRAFIEASNFSLPSHAQLEDALTQLHQAKADAKVLIHFADSVLRRYQNQAYLLPQAEEIALSQKTKSITLVDFTAQLETIPLLETICGAQRVSFTISKAKEIKLKVPTENQEVTIRFGLSGSTHCQPHFRDKGRTLKKLWQELKVPPWERAHVPMVFIDDKLICAVGYWFEKSALVDANSVGMTITKITEHER